MISEVSEIELPKGTRVKITDSQDKNAIGIIGAVRHSFPLSLWGSSRYKLSIEVEKEFRDIVGNIYNLVPEDKYTPIFVSFCKEKSYYYIEGINYILGQVMLRDFNDIIKKYNGIYDYDLKRYAFTEEQSCIDCLQYFQEAFTL